MGERDYRSGDDFVLEFVDHRFGFSADDFRERVTAAAARLELVDAAGIDDAAAGDLVEVAATGSLDTPRSALGRHLASRWEEIAWHDGQSLVYWLRKLVFRSAWLDARVKEGLLDVVFDESTADFSFRLPNDERPLVELAGAPSWRAVRFPSA